MLLVTLMICISLRMSCIMNLHIYPLFPLAVAILLAVIIILITGGLAVGVFLNYKRTGSFIPSMPKLPRFLPLLFGSVFFQLKLWWSSRYRFQTKVQVFVFCFCSASAAWWNPLTLGMGWRFGRVIMWISDPHTLECHSLTQACRWWVLDKCIQAANHFQDH